jgi:thiol-disulfide isomerase/thioredoxin
MNHAIERRRCLQWLGGALTTSATASTLFATNAAATAPLSSTGLPVLAAWPHGKKTPELQVQTLDGQRRTTAHFAGAPLLINFWATYCAPCRLEMHLLNALLRQFQSQGLQVLTINHGEMPARVRQFFATVPFNGEILLDRSQTQLAAWGGMALPSSYVLDASGQVRLWHVGELDWTRADIQMQLQQVFNRS